MNKKIELRVNFFKNAPIHSIEKDTDWSGRDEFMRIDGYNKITQLYQNSKVTKTSGTQSVADSRDAVSISQSGSDYQIAKNAVKTTSDIRTDLVSDLKQKVDSGTYNVSADDFASKLIEKFKELQ